MEPDPGRLRLLFARHGESEANLLREISNRGRRHGLTARGRRQAHALAQTLRAQAIERIYASPLLRAQQTAEILAAALGAPVEPADALREYDYGIAEGRSDPEAWALYDALAEAWRNGAATSRIEGGESLLDIEGRFRPFVERLVAQRRRTGGRVVLVGHGGLYRWVLPGVLRNIDLAFSLAHTITYTGVVLAEAVAGDLICTAWCEQAPPQ